MLIVCILLALLCAGLAFWVWAQRRSLREAAYRLRALEDTGSTARVRLAVPNSAAEELLDEVNRLLELRQADRAAYQARERALRQQIANVSHDLRTPLTSILGYLQLLEDPGLTEGERREYLAVIVGRARTLQSLITSFYDLSRLEGGEYLLQREKVDLYASLSGLLAAFYNDFTDRGFDMEVELAEGLPQVWADAGAVPQRSGAWRGAHGNPSVPGGRAGGQPVFQRNPRPDCGGRAPRVRPLLYLRQDAHRPEHRLGPGHCQSAGRADGLPGGGRSGGGYVCHHPPLAG